MLKELSFEEFEQQFSENLVVPVYREVIGDWVTPVTVFSRLASGKNYAFLIDHQAQGRYSYIGRQPFLVLKIRGNRIQLERPDETLVLSEDPLVSVRKILSRYTRKYASDLPPFMTGLVGYLAYDAARWVIPVADPHLSDQEFDDGFLMFFKHLLVFDHYLQKIYLVATVFPDQDKHLTPEQRYEQALDQLDELEDQLFLAIQTIPSVISKDISIVPRSIYSGDSFEHMILSAREAITDEELDHLTLANRWEMRIDASPLYLFRAMRLNFPSSASFFFHLKDRYVMGYAQQPLVSRTGAQLTSVQEDEASFATLSQLLPISDIRPGDSCVIPDFPQLVNNEQDSLELIFRHFPGAALCGCPVERAMELIDQLEDHRRGPAGGALIALDANGNFEVSVSPYTAFFRKGKFHVDMLTKVSAQTEWADIRIFQDEWSRGLQEILDFARNDLR